MESLQQIIYKQLPISIKSTIVKNKEDFQEYNSVILRLNNDLLSSYKTKVKLTKKDITLMSILLSVYYHIKDNSPEKMKMKGENFALKSWFNFVEKNYPFYEELEDDVERWPKFMFLLYYTYLISYRSFYKTKQISALDIEIPEYNKKNLKFITYIYMLYKYLDKNITLEDFRFYGY